MPELERSAVVRQVLNVLQEAVEGSSGAWTYFIDKRPDGGVLGALATLGATEASTAVAGSTIAAHAHHAGFAMNASAAAIQGDRTHPDWKASWRVTTVDDVAWTQLVEQFRRDYQRLRAAIETRAWSSEEAFGETLGAIAHIAYHLGSIRQKLAALRPAKE